MTVQQVYENIMRDALSVYSAEGLKEKLESGKTLKIKLPRCTSAIFDVETCERVL